MRRLLLLAALCMALALVLGAPAMAQDPSAVNCEDFQTQPEAQAFFEANDPANDPFLLDEDPGADDGVACEALPPGGGATGGGDTTMMEEPTTVEPTTVEPTTVEPTTASPTASPTTSPTASPTASAASLPATGGPVSVMALASLALLAGTGIMAFGIARRS